MLFELYCTAIFTFVCVGATDTFHINDRYGYVQSQ